MSRELFDNNKIVEALCQFTFSPIQDNTIYGQFWDELKKGSVYTSKENISAFNFTLTDDEKGVTPSLVNAMKFSNDSKEKVIQLHNNNISIHQLKSYLKWEIFKSEIDATFRKFNAVSNAPVIERIDLRAINVFEFDSEEFELNEYFNIYPVCPDNFDKPQTNITVEWPLPDGKSFIVARLNTNQKQKMNVVLDLSYVVVETKLQSDEYEKVSELLEVGHAKLYSLFTSIITRKTKELIK